MKCRIHAEELSPSSLVAWILWGVRGILAGGSHYSDALADLVGESRLSRPQTVKRIWDYVKERGLQDEKDKRYILCDDKLRNVFHSDKVHMFTYVLPLAGLCCLPFRP